MELADQFLMNNQLEKQDLESIYQMTSSKYGKQDWSQSTKKLFEFAWHLSLVSECLICDENIEDVRSNYEEMMEWVDNKISDIIKPKVWTASDIISGLKWSEKFNEALVFINFFLV